MMHIVYVSADQGIPVFGSKGASVHVQEMIRAFMAQGAEVTILSPRLEGEPPPEMADVSCIALPRSLHKDSSQRAQVSIDTNALIVRTLLSLRPYDLIYERHSLFIDAPMSTAASMGIPGVLEVNAPLIDEQERHRFLPRAVEARIHARRAMSCAQVVSAVSPAVARYAQSLGARAGRVHVIENGVNPRRFPTQSRPTGPFTIGFLGTLKPWHDVSTLVKGFCLLRLSGVDSRLLIVGDGPERIRLQALVDSLHLHDVVEFTGMQQPEDVPQQLARMHVAVAPYCENQPFYFSPLKIYEYMMAGLPVVASRVGNLDAVVADARTGLLCNPGDPEALAGVLALLAGNKELANRLGDNARQHVLVNHDWNNIALRVLDLASVEHGLTIAS